MSMKLPLTASIVVAALVVVTIKEISDMPHVHNESELPQGPNVRALSYDDSTTAQAIQSTRLNPWVPRDLSHRWSR